MVNITFRHPQAGSGNNERARPEVIEIEGVWPGSRQSKIKKY